MRLSQQNETEKIISNKCDILGGPKRRKPIEIGNSIAGTIPNKWVLTEAIKHGYNSVKAFILDYELEFSERIPEGGGFFDGELLIRFVRRRNT